tara:strand:+ start:923 stop:2782 length:1860 start_codon:yes stop_codon:yes gene_type:complete
MCGILGFILSEKKFEKEKFVNSLNTLKHRGPDEVGVWTSPDKKVFLGHRRLSIIDLSKKAKQPMKSMNNDKIIVFNGEIYNFTYLKKILIKKGYKFKTKSDTEVILVAYQEWGEDCLNYLEGMFSFCIYDTKNKKLFLARDRVGEKPLFYLYNGKDFLFASELKAILSSNLINAKIDPLSLDLYLNMGFIPGENCIIKGIKKLPPGYAISFSLINKKINIWNYWKLPKFNTIIQYSYNEIIEKLSTLIEDSVKRQMISDVPLGVLLSGGLDSSLITAMAAKNSNKIKTFNIGFPEYKKFDETDHARLVSKYFNTEHFEINAGEIKPEILNNLSYQFDEPMADSSMIPTYLISECIKKYCTVALGGDGGDELFGGYPHYSRLIWLEQTFQMIPVKLRKFLSKIIYDVMPIGLKGRNWIKALSTDFNSESPFIAEFFNRKERVQFLPFLEDSRFNSDQVQKECFINENNILDTLTRNDFRNYLPEDILVKVDRSSMLNSLEIRAPFLDKNIVEFAFESIPNKLKATSNNKKIVLKNIAENFLPKEFDFNRKQGFSVPLSEWINNGKFGDFFKEVLLDESSIFNKNAIIKLFDRNNTYSNNSERIFALVIFQMWKNKYSLEM